VLGWCSYIENIAVQEVGGIIREQRDEKRQLKKENGKEEL